MTTLNQREHAMETEFAHQEELKFKARERAAKGLAVWAARQLGKTGEALEVYARDIVAADVANSTTEATIDRIAEDLAPKGVGKNEVRRMIDRFAVAAAAAVRSPLQRSR
jgi:hypothetical protein